MTAAGDTERNVQTITELFSAIQRRDGQRVLELYHPDIEFHDAPSLPYGGVVRGKEQVAAHMYGSRGWAATWIPLQPTEAERRLDPRVVAASDREVVVLWRQRALSAPGDRFDAPVLALYELREGKLVRAQMFHFDTAAIRDFLSRATDRTDSEAPSTE